MKIGIVGFGYVGSAVAASYPKSNVMIADPAYPDISVSTDELKSQCAVIFVCVPTPSGPAGCEGTRPGLQAPRSCLGRSYTGSRARVPARGARPGPG